MPTVDVVCRFCSGVTAVHPEAPIFCCCKCGAAHDQRGALAAPRVDTAGLSRPACARCAALERPFNLNGVEILDREVKLEHFRNWCQWAGLECFWMPVQRSFGVVCRNCASHAAAPPARVGIVSTGGALACDLHVDRPLTQYFTAPCAHCGYIEGIAWCGVCGVLEGGS